MKMKMAVAAVLALTSMGFVAPAVEAGKSVPGGNCTSTYNSTTKAITLSGTWQGIRYASVISVLGDVKDGNTRITNITLVFNRDSRTSGSYSGSFNDVLVTPTSVDVVIYHGRSISTINCIFSVV